MINRVLIRSKVLQIAYAYYQNESCDIRKAEKEFETSLEKSHELYISILQLMVSITDYAEQRIEIGRNKYLPTEAELHPNTRFIDNLFIQQLRVNKEFCKVNRNAISIWQDQEGLVRKLYEQVINSPFYSEYIESPVPQEEKARYEADKELWRKIVKGIITEGGDTQEALEEISIFWNDDLETISTFIIKTIKRFDLQEGADQPLLPMYKEEKEDEERQDDKQFAWDLFHAAILHGDRYRKMITDVIQNWELERLALMDLLILQIALAEIMEIPDIPVNVSFNEYIDLAKVFSTEKSGLFINGTLDRIVQTLREQGLLFKV